ncbi:MAG: amidohydrolase [Clostridiales bacterium]|nr:amidohydrolase [Clostridiales bacterium]
MIGTSLVNLDARKAAVLEIIDFHAHVYPDRIAQKASESIAAFYDIPVQFPGRVSTLLERGDAGGISRFVIHSVATAPEQVRSINGYIARAVSESAGRFIGFAAIHPDCDDIAGEIDRALGLGLRGLKIHPDFQRFPVDGPGACRIFEAARGRLPVLIHTGDFRYDYSNPERVARALDWFPELTVIGAHFGGWSQWEQAARALAGRPNLFVDTSSSLYAIAPERARALIRLYGADRVLFGSDFPMWDPALELTLLGRVGLTDDERERVLYRNARELLGL